MNSYRIERHSGRKQDIIKVMDYHGRCLLHTDLTGGVRLLQMLMQPCTSTTRWPIVRHTEATPKSPTGEFIERTDDFGSNANTVQLRLHGPGGIRAELHLYTGKQLSEFLTELASTIGIDRSTIPRTTRTTLRGLKFTAVPRSETVTVPFRHRGPRAYTVESTNGFVTVRDTDDNVLIHTDASGTMALIQQIERGICVRSVASLRNPDGRDTQEVPEHLVFEHINSSRDKVNTLVIERVHTRTPQRSTGYGPGASASVVLVGLPQQKTFVKALKQAIPRDTPRHDHGPLPMTHFTVRCEPDGEHDLLAYVTLCQEERARRDEERHRFPQS